MIKIPRSLLMNWVQDAQEKAKKGKLPHYIPYLQQINPDHFSFYAVSLQDEELKAGNLSLIFPLMSVIKPFLLLYCLKILGEKVVFQKVGKLTSDYPFNSLKQLEKDQGFPRNPMINSGAILLSSLVRGNTSNSRCQNLLTWLNETANCRLFLDETVLRSVQSKPNPKNQALVNYLVEKNSLKNPEIALETYNMICCLSGKITDLAKLGLLLLKDNPEGLIVQEIMLSSGLYEASQTFAETIGFPTKSGVSGTILAIIPHKGVIACYSPPLDAQGNSILGLYLIEKIAQFHDPLF